MPNPQPFPDEIHDTECELRLTAGRGGPCTCVEGPWIRKPQAPEPPPVVAVVQAGDTLIFLIPELKSLDAIRYAEARLTDQYPGIRCTVVSAVGVVHLPAPELSAKIDENLMGRIREHLEGKRRTQPDRLGP